MGLAPEGDPAPLVTALRLRKPGWASGAEAGIGGGEPRPVEAEGSYLVFERAFRAGEKVRARFLREPTIEDRRMRVVEVDPSR